MGGWKAVGAGSGVRSVQSTMTTTKATAPTANPTMRGDVPFGRRVVGIRGQYRVQPSARKPPTGRTGRVDKRLLASDGTERWRRFFSRSPS
jgi:hypothetical protein